MTRPILWVGSCSTFPVPRSTGNCNATARDAPPAEQPEPRIRRAEDSAREPTALHAPDAVSTANRRAPHRQPLPKRSHPLDSSPQTQKALLM